MRVAPREQDLRQAALPALVSFAPIKGWRWRAASTLASLANTKTKIQLARYKHALMYNNAHASYFRLETNTRLRLRALSVIHTGIKAVFCIRCFIFECFDFYASLRFSPPPSVGGLDLDSRSSGCARLGGEVGPPLGVVVEEVAVSLVSSFSFSVFFCLFVFSFTWNLARSYTQPGRIVTCVGGGHGAR